MDKLPAIGFGTPAIYMGNEIELPSRIEDEDFLATISRYAQALLQRITKLEEDQEKDKQETLRLKGLVGQRQKELKDIKERNIGLVNECNSLKKTIETLQKQCDILLVDNKEAEKQNATLKNENDELLKIYSEANKDIRALKWKNQSLQLSSLWSKKKLRKAQKQITQTHKNTQEAKIENKEIIRRLQEHQFETGIQEKIIKWEAEFEGQSAAQKEFWDRKFTNFFGLALAPFTYGTTALIGRAIY